MSRLVFYRGSRLDPSDAVISWHLPLGRTRIGRTDDCDIVLPDDDVSRSHAIIDNDGKVATITDRSLNGTWVNGVSVKKHLLAHRDVVRMGSFFAVVDARVDDAPTERAQLERPHEELIYAGDGVAVNEAWLVVTRGPDSGKRIKLRGGHFGVGGEGSDVVIVDATLVANHVRVKLIHGRTIIEPGQGGFDVAGVRVRSAYPVYATEEVVLGESGFRVEWVERHDRPQADQFGEMVATSPTMRQIFGALRRVAAHHAPVLLVGESGTGKELAAQAIHDASPRAGTPFVPINCGAIAANLFESELFGHEKGAFTGATERKDGAFQRANGGTLFLDEVGELPEDAQAKLLRTLETGEVRRVGGAEVVFPDVRVVAATNRMLPEEVRNGGFRADLFYRLSVIAVRLPALRERPEDIPVTARAIAAKVAPGLVITPAAMEALVAYPWPGNARELRNVITRAHVLFGPRIEPEHIVFAPLEGFAPPPTPKGNAFDDAEREVILEALRRVGNNRSEAARILGIPRSSFLYKLKRAGVDKA